jgi:hypothetical protein
MDENDFDELAQVGAEHKRELLQAALPVVAGLRGCTVKAPLPETTKIERSSCKHGSVCGSA